MPPIYTPTHFQSGSSLSHWANGISGGALMEPTLGLGQVKRAYAPVDKGALMDIGWRLEGVNAANPCWNLYR